MTVDQLAGSLPDIERSREISISLAMLDALVAEPEFRYYTYDPAWGSGEQLASMANGSGDEYSIVFSSVGAFIRGFDHESPMAPHHTSPPQVWSGVTDDMPSDFIQYIDEPSFTDGQTPLITFCLWRYWHQHDWRYGNVALPSGHDDPDGSGWMFALVTGDLPRRYVTFAEEVYELELDEPTVTAFSEMRPLNSDLVARLGSELTWRESRELAEAIGYPVSQ